MLRKTNSLDTEDSANAQTSNNTCYTHLQRFVPKHSETKNTQAGAAHTWGPQGCPPLLLQWLRSHPTPSPQSLLLLPQVAKPSRAALKSLNGGRKATPFNHHFSIVCETEGKNRTVMETRGTSSGDNEIDTASANKKTKTESKKSYGYKDRTVSHTCRRHSKGLLRKSKGRQNCRFCRHRERRPQQVLLREKN